MNDKDFKKSYERISKFILYDQSRDLSFPKNVQDCIPENHVARMVSPIVGFIDMGAIKLSYMYGGGPHAQSEN